MLSVYIYFKEMEGESKGLSVFMPTGKGPQVTGTGSHETSRCVPLIERQFTDIFMIHHIFIKEI